MNGRMMAWFWLLSVALPLCLCGEERHPVTDYYAEPAADPLEGFNRCMEGFNAGCVKYVARPVGKYYTLIVPHCVREGIDNFASNLQFPLSLVNNCLQGKFDGAWNETKRFGINTTVGILGVRDQAKGWGMPARKEDFGQTFGYYGSGPWFYLNLPLMGPCSGRDGVGMLLGLPFDLGNYLFGGFSTIVKMSAAGNAALSNSNQLSEYFLTRYESYELTRAAFLCYRDAQIADFAFTPTDEKYELEESMGYVLLKTRSERFGWSGIHGAVQLDGAKDDLPYTVWLPKQRDGRLIFLLPGIGSHRDSHALAALAEPFVNGGWTVVTISNTYSPDYFLHTRDTHLPGRPSRDCVELEHAMARVRADVERRFPQAPGMPSESVCLGFSLGAINTLHLAARAQRGESAVAFDRYVAVNPPVDPLHALRKIDTCFDIPMTWPTAERRRRIEETLRKVANLVNHRDEITNLEIPLTLDECRFIIGANMRLVLCDLLIASRETFAPDALLNYPPTADLEVLKHRALDVSYDDYVRHFMADGQEDFETLVARERLTSLETELKAAANVRVMHNGNDFLMRPEDFAWLKATLGDRLTMFERGGHLGNLHVPDVQKKLFELVTDEKR